MQNSLRFDRRHACDRVVLERPRLGELTRVTPPRNSERKAAWYAKALKAEYDFMTGPLWARIEREYERQAIGTAQPELG